MNLLRSVFVALSTIVNLCTFACAQDIAGSSDSQLFPNRMPGYSISNYQQLGFGSYMFHTVPPKTVEGKYTRIDYYLKERNLRPGGLAIRRNYENAIKAVGGQVLHSDNSASVMKVNRNGTETWAELKASLSNNSSPYYFLHIVECEPMLQVITADAMGAAIDKDGFVALDIHFATGKADIQQDSRPTIAQIVELLEKRKDLQVGIEGHTDSTGNPTENLSLSDARAKAVMSALCAAGINARRLDAVGYGQTRPIADNRTVDGRAKNRRVEIVKR